MKYIYTLCFVMLACGVVQAQSFLDDFNDGAITEWLGMPESFIANGSGELQLNGDCAAGGDAYIYQVLPTAGETEWSFQVRLDFEPSSANHTRIFLQSDITDLTGEVHGYFVRLGEDGTGDLIKLWKSSGASANLLITGTTSVATNPNIGVKVIRTASSEWQLWVDPDGGTDYLLEGTAVDDTYPTGNYAGFRCKYSSTRCDLFYFDDYYINPLYIDDVPPALEALTVLNGTQLLVDFNEVVELSSAETEINYTVTGGVGNPISALADAIDASKVILTFAAPFPEGILLTLAINGVQDESGNATSGLTEEFSWYILHAFDIVINEVMADPDPAIGLPAEEYVELYNTTDAPIDLSNCMLSDASGPSDPFVSYVLPSHGYVILVDDGNIDAFAAYSNVLPVAGFPSLNNDGDDLSLMSPDTIALHSISYTTDWYQNAIKADGGWSLEMIDPTNPCQGESNWSASENASGGTPGAENSIFGTNPDVDAPYIINAYPQTADTILITFSEPILLDLITPADIVIVAGTGETANVVSLIIDTDNAERVGAVLSAPITPGITYYCSVNNAQDCGGNIISGATTFRFGLPEPAAEGDVAINEILFNAVSDAFDYIEIYNVSNKIIDLSTLIIAELELADTTQVDEFTTISPDGKLMFPGQYMCITADIEGTLNQYFAIDTGNFIQNSNTPNLPDAEGIVVLYDAALNELDHVHYWDDWHYALLSDDDGVSLERVNYSFPAQDESNWSSAASDAHFGTPGYQNSVFGEIGSTATLGLEYQVFSPDGDGYHDLMVITYNTDVEGYTGTVLIYDAQGRLVKTLINNDLLGRAGFFTWDGLNDNDEKMPSGIYIVYAELFNLEGNIEHFKIKGTLVRKQ